MSQPPDAPSLQAEVEACPRCDPPRLCSEHFYARLRLGDAGRTHHTSCWVDHFDCAVARVRELEQEVDELRERVRDDAIVSAEHLGDVREDR